MKMYKIACRLLGMLLVLCLLGCGTGAKTETPKKLTETFLNLMKEGEYEEAYTHVGMEYDKGKQQDSLQNRLMKLAYGNMKYSVLSEQIEDGRATVVVQLQNVNFLKLMDDAVFETMKLWEEDAYTEQIFPELMQKAEVITAEVLVAYRRTGDKWVFDGDNSQLDAAMLGYLVLPSDEKE